MRPENALSWFPIHVLPAGALLRLQLGSFIIIIGAAASCCWCGHGAHGADINWNVDSGDWSTAANWLPTTEPTANDNAHINGGRTASVTQSGEICSSLFLADSAAASGSVDMPAGNPSASLTVTKREYIGYSGTGTFVQTAGTHKVYDVSSTYGDFYVGYNANSHGAYTLSNGSFHGDSQYIGYYGTGTFEQTGGSNYCRWGLSLGYQTGSSGSYTLSGGSLSTNYNINTTVGLSGTGTFTQNGGTFSNGNSGDLYVGYNAYSWGTYNLSAGQSSSYNVYLASGGAGTLTQTGGTHNVGNLLYLAYSVAGNGTYNLSGTGSLSTANYEYVGYKGTGTFDQSGGSHTLTSSGAVLYLGYNAGSQGTYKISESGTLTTPYLIAGYSGKGTIVQSGGTINIAKYLSVGHYSGSDNRVTQTGGEMKVSQYLALGHYNGAKGTYELSGTGSLSVTGDEYIGSVDGTSSAGTGTFTQSGGTNSISHDLHLGFNNGSSGTYNLSGGVLSAGGSGGGGEDVGTYGGSTGTFTHTGGANYATCLHVGGYGGTGTYTLSGSGQLIVATDEWIPRSGYGTFTQTGGSNTVLGQLIVSTNSGYGYVSNSTGTYNLNGGTLIVKSISVGPGPGTTTFNFGGGTLQASADISTERPLPMTLTGTGGNANVDTAGHHVTLSGLLSGVGGLNKRGAGTLTLSAANTYSGPTTVYDGTLEITAGIDAGGTSLLDIQSGTAILKGVDVSKPSLDIHNAVSGAFEVATGSHTVGAIAGGGTTKIDDGAHLTAASIIQDTLTIGSGASVTIAATASGAANAVPEPSTFALLAIGAAGLLCVAWRRKA